MNPDDADRPNQPLSELPEVRRCLASNKIVYVEDVRRDSELAMVHDGGDALSIMAVPLHMRHAADHRIVFRMARTGDPFTYREIKFCQIVTTVAANALENAQLYESLEIAHSQLTEISKKDPLTDVYNRRYLFERLEVEFARSVRKRAPLSAIMLDIDHFKRVNDDLGHQAGDSVLIGFGQILKNCLRGQDLVGRYGGEEFLIVLPETDDAGAVMVAERIRREVRQHQFARASGRKVTCSLGIAVRDPATTATPTVESLVALADHALYEAKSGGRDRAVVALSLTEAVAPEAR